MTTGKANATTTNLISHSAIEDKSSGHEETSVEPASSNGGAPLETDLITSTQTEQFRAVESVATEELSS
jgi:hypothetical protein